jgi:tripeptidyl-peptidase-1
MSVSHPSSPQYGKLWTAEDVRNAFAPSKESIETVRSWLSDAGIEHVEETRGWLVFDTTIAHAEKMMQSEYYEHEDLETGAVRLGCDT